MLLVRARVQGIMEMEWALVAETGTVEAQMIFWQAILTHIPVGRAIKVSNRFKVFSMAVEGTGSILPFRQSRIRIMSSLLNIIITGLPESRCRLLRLLARNRITNQHLRITSTLLPFCTTPIHRLLVV